MSWSPTCIAVLAFTTFSLGLAVPAAHGQTTSSAALTTAPQSAAMDPTTTPGAVRLPSGVIYEVVKEGTGPELTTGATALIHYILTGDKGEAWDNSRTRPVPKPFKFKTFTGYVVSGMDQGTAGMKVGERRIIHVPPQHGYGSRQAGGIPPNSNLHFDVELVAIVPETQESAAQTTGTQDTL